MTSKKVTVSCSDCGRLWGQCCPDPRGSADSIAFPPCHGVARRHGGTRSSVRPASRRRRRSVPQACGVERELEECKVGRRAAQPTTGPRGRRTGGRAVDPLPGVPARRLPCFLLAGVAPRAPRRLASRGRRRRGLQSKTRRAARQTHPDEAREALGPPPRQRAHRREEPQQGRPEGRRRPPAIFLGELGHALITMKIVDAGCAVVAGVAGASVAATPADDFKRHAALSLSDLCATLGDICKDISRQDAVEVSSCQRSLPAVPPAAGVPLAPGVCEVQPHLLLGGAAALRPGLLATLGVTCVINCAAELANFPVPENVTYLRVPLADHPSAALDQHLDTVADAIEEVRLQGGRTLVHCLAGVSRSAAMVLGYLVKHHAMPLAEAFSLVRAARPMARPNSGFFRQLIDWERQHLGAMTVSMVEHPALGAPIPDVYLEDYRNTFLFHSKYSNRTCGGR